MHEGGYRKHLGSHSGTRYSLILKGASNQACSATRSGLLEQRYETPLLVHLKLWLQLLAVHLNPGVESFDL